jgi:hypothetical protein
LALSRRLVEAMGGRIGVKSRRGVGTTFWVELEAAQPAAVEVGAGAGDDLLATRDYPSELRVLYVEDVSPTCGSWRRSSPAVQAFA